MKYIFFILVTCLCLTMQAQIPPGTWRMHVPYNEALGIEKAGKKLIVATSSGIFHYDTEDGTIEFLNKVNGLSDAGISAFARHPTRDIVMVGYENGNLDIIKGTSVRNLRDIINAGSPGSKRINRIQFSGNLAYLSCDFGIVVYNIDKEEVRESNTILGSGGKTIPVLDCLSFSDTLYAITKEGLKMIPKNKPLKNTDLWSSIGPESGVPANPADLLTLDSAGEFLMMGSWFGLHVKNGARYDLNTSLGGKIRSVRRMGEKILVCVGNNVVELDKTGKNILRTFDPEYFKRISRPAGAVLDDNGISWVADLDNGLLRFSLSDTSRILPNGPQFSESFSLSTYRDKVVMHAGGFTYPTGNQSNNISSGFAILSGNEWTTFNRQTSPKMPAVKDITQSFFDPQEQKLYLSTFGYGILTMDKDNKFGLINDSTTEGALCNLFVPDCIYNASNPAETNLGSTYIRITSASKDAAGNLWATCFNNSRGSVRYQSVEDNSWNIITLPSANDDFPMEITHDQFTNKWVRMAPGMLSENAAIWVLDSKGEKKAKLTSDAAFGGLPSNEVYDIKEDKTGYMWVGTSKGLAVFYNPGNVFFQGGITASTPIFPPEAGRPVLENEVVTAIEVDGANRKWIGTKGSGVWLFNEDISQVIKQFNTSNSPLTSNFIYDIVVNKVSGEVFFATDKGLISFQGDATENLDDFGKPLGNVCDESRIKVFPNPVPKNFDGVIAVQGLAPNAEVRFVSPSGKLMYKTNAKGSMATWNGFTYDGKKAPPGIYLMLTTSPDGAASCTGKIAILD